MEFINGTDTYFIKDDMAFTEDKVCVYNLFIFNIPPKIKEDDLIQYFQQFGEVKKLILIGDKIRRISPKGAFIHFADALVAAKVLQMPNHAINSKQISIKACDSWDQPQPTRSDPITEELGVSTLMNLNDDCLEIICKKLNIRDQVHFSLVCERFRSIFKMCCKRQHRLLRLDKLSDLTLLEIHEFFKIAGPSIKVIIGAIPIKDRVRITEFISNCTKVSTLILDGCKLQAGHLRTLVNKMKDITELQLFYCSLNNNAVLALKELPKLKILMLVGNYKITGKYLHLLSSLRVLNLSACRNIYPSHFKNVCISLKELEVLNIQWCVRLNVDVFDTMQAHCHKLETLTMSRLEICSEHIARLPALKRLEVIVDNGMMPFDELTVLSEFLPALALHKSDQLEYLALSSITPEMARHISKLSKLKSLNCISSDMYTNITDDCLRHFCDLENLEEIVLRNCRSITNEGLLSLVKHCPKLKTVNIQLCTKITDQFVFDVMEYLRYRKRDQKYKDNNDPIKFYVCYSSISESMIYDAKYQTIFEDNQIVVLPFDMRNTFGYNNI